MFKANALTVACPETHYVPFLDRVRGCSAGEQATFEEIAVDLLQARFWITSGLPTNRPESDHHKRVCLLIGFWRAIVAHGCYSTLAADTPAPHRVSFQQGGRKLIPRSVGVGMLLLVISVAGRCRRLHNCGINQPTHQRLEQTHEETKHGYDYSERRHAHLLQGLGNRPASLFPSWLAAVCGRLGCTDDVLPGARLPGDRS